ncbi:unnamed protein product, partial [Didymodactylos carnosus]
MLSTWTRRSSTVRGQVQ